jgi:Ribbon-helix-helix protein, copG family
MYTVYIVKRTQIYLEEEQSAQLAERARHRGTTASHVIREAVDAYLAQPESEDDRALQRYRAALDGAFGVAPHLPGGTTHVDELRAADVARGARLEQRRRP